jgi:RNA polymerase sigma factor (sigma-70 family)
MDDDDRAIRAWFCQEVLSFEPVLTGFIRRYWRTHGDVADIRQDVYEKVLIAAARERPRQTGPYLIATARNIMINRARRARVISIDLMGNLDELILHADWLTPERHHDGRQELRRLEAGLAKLPPRCREVMSLRKLEGASTREVARRLGISVAAVEQQTTLGMRALVDWMLGGEGKIKRRFSASEALARRTQDG